MKNNLKTTLQFIAGFLFSLVGYIPISIICSLLIPGDNDSSILLALFFACPLGSIAGIFLIERIFFKVIRWNSTAFGMAIASGWVGGLLLGFAMLDEISDIRLLIQLIITGLVLTGYNFTLSVTFKEARRSTH